jgi:hypothetical protein
MSDLADAGHPQLQDQQRKGDGDDAVGQGEQPVHPWRIVRLAGSTRIRRCHDLSIPDLRRFPPIRAGTRREAG